MIVNHYQIANKIANKYNLPVQTILFLVKFQCKVASINLKHRVRVGFFKFIYFRVYPSSCYWKEFMKLNDLYDKEWRYDLRFQYYFNFNTNRYDEDAYYKAITAAITNMGLSINDFTYPKKTISKSEAKLRDRKAKKGVAHKHY